MSGSMIGGVDSNIALQVRAPAQPNPLEAIGQFAGIQNALNAARFVPGALQLQQQAVTRGQVDQSQLINRASYQAMTPLLAKTGPISLSDVTTALGSLEANMGIPTHGVIQHIMEGGPSATGPGFSDWMRAQILSQTQPPESAAGAIAPTQGVIDNNQVIQPTLTPRPGMPGQGIVSTSGQGFGKGLSPDFLAMQVGRPATAAEAAKLGIPVNTPLLEPMVTRLYSQGVPTTAGRATIGAPAPAAMGSGAYPGQAKPTSAPAQNGGPGYPPGTPMAIPTPRATGGPTVAGLAPGVGEAATEQVGPAQVMANRVGAFKSDMFPLLSAQQAIEAAPTGKGSEAVHAASSYINTFAPSIIQKGLAFITPLMSKDEVAAYDEAKKYLTQGQLGIPGATRSNEGGATAGAASPSTQISKEAAQVVLKGMIALRRMEQDEGQAWIQSGKPPSELNKFRADFQKQADPRVYMFDQMTTAQRKQTLGGITDPAKRQAFIASVNRAEQNGVLAAPGAPQ